MYYLIISYESTRLLNKITKTKVILSVVFILMRLFLAAAQLLINIDDKLILSFFSPTGCSAVYKPKAVFRIVH